MISHGGLTPGKQASHHVIRMNIQEKRTLDYWVLLIDNQTLEGMGPLLNTEPPTCQNPEWEVQNCPARDPST